MPEVTRDLIIIVVLFIVFLFIRPELNISDNKAPPVTTSPPTTTLPPTTSPPTTVPPPTTSPPTTVPPPTSPSEPKPPLEVVDVTLSEGPGGQFWIAGKIRNNGDVELFFVQVRLTLYNKYGDVLDMEKTPPIDRLDPDQTLEFNMIKSEILKINIASYNLTTENRE